jgi:serine kinase of HPr protein (carbohydrate metabolism regulator)
MTAKELAGKLNLEIVFDNGDDREIKNCYVGDLLSWVMGRAKPDSVWVTIMSNVNVAAVASLTDMAVVIFAESVEPDKELYDKMAKSDALFCKSPLSAYELSWRIREVSGV